MSKTVKKNHSKLKGRMREKGESYRSLAEKIGITASTLSNKLNGHTIFDADEIYKIIQVLDINQEDIGLYFFD